MFPDGYLSLSVLDNTYRPVWEQQSWSCNCACSTCMAGQCCMDPNRYQVPPYVGTGTGFASPLHEHSWQAVGMKKGDVIQSCSCGQVRRVPIPSMTLER